MSGKIFGALALTAAMGCAELPAQPRVTDPSHVGERCEKALVRELHERTGEEAALQEAMRAVRKRIAAGTCKGGKGELWVVPSADSSNGGLAVYPIPPEPFPSGTPFSLDIPENYSPPGKTTDNIQ